MDGDEAQFGVDTFNKTFLLLRNSLDNVYMIESDYVINPRPERLRELQFAIATLEFFNILFQDNYDIALKDGGVDGV